MSLRYAKLLIFWGVAFIVSLFLIFTGFGNEFPLGSDGSNGSDLIPLDPDEPEEPEDEGANLNIILGVVSAVTSGAGFIVTTIFALRDDRRETALHELQIKNLKQEIEQKDLEIKKLRQEREPYDTGDG